MSNVLDFETPEMKKAIEVMGKDRNSLGNLYQFVDASTIKFEPGEFAHLRFRDDNFCQDAEYYGAPLPEPHTDCYAKFVRIDEPGTEYSREMYDILHVNSSNPDLKMGRGLQDGDYYSTSGKYKEMAPLSEAEREKCKEWEKEFDAMHERADYDITGTLYSVEPTYYDWDKEHHFPNFAEIDKKIWEHIPVKSIDDAKRWVLENYPDYYMGMSASQNCPSGNFIMGAVPCIEYGENMYKTYADRRNWAEQEAARLGCTIGPQKVFDAERGYVLNIIQTSENEFKAEIKPASNTDRAKGEQIFSSLEDAVKQAFISSNKINVKSLSEEEKIMAHFYIDKNINTSQQHSKKPLGIDAEISR